ncbi:phosphatidylglycerophosphatase and protein-tyrosine phosphatase 1 [Periophthalmus magnuspinnatus]|uniref:phosphatidylglycerophosphatase and protein-tyrosine phosphatase 1 n=1 Tax=Periophthalmus magnuspinnatus TaxID=409849 RepID=UPI00145BBEBA|nr:phosphatidylglycerophosphatase and protein-tyrosine phosphatase 1 [Periophthalmus magnuspinnatus]
MAWLTARLLFYPTLAYNLLMERWSSRRWFDRVDPNLILGALPFKSMTKQLVEEEHVGGVITMNEEYETQLLCNSTQEWQEAGVEQLRLSTVDLLGVPSLEHLHRGVEFAVRHRDQGNTVYVHCKAGRCRSATMAAAYLIRVYCVTPDEACERLRALRPHVILRSNQLSLLQDFYRQVCAQGQEEQGPGPHM